MKTDLCTLDWVAISAIATGLMAIATFVSLKELKRQWREQNKPRLMPLFVIYDRNSREGYLRIKNISGTAAFNVSVEISMNIETGSNSSYIQYNELVEELKKITFSLEPLGVKDFKFLEGGFPESKYEGHLDIQIRYNNTYCEEFMLHLSEFSALGDSITNENAIARRLDQLAQKMDGIESALRTICRR